MEASPFARLSPELRNTIYDFAFDSDYAVTIQHNAIQHGIVRTCRQLRRETLDMYYSLARFNAHLDDGPPTPLARWLTVLGRDACLLLREVNIWDLHMLNATIHGVESTEQLMRSTTAEGKKYVLQPTGSWLLHTNWYLKDLVIALHHLGLELRNLSTVNEVPGQTGTLAEMYVEPPEWSIRPQRTSHFAIVPMSDEALLEAPRCRHPSLRDLLRHLGFADDVIEEVFDGLEGIAQPEGAKQGLFAGIIDATDSSNFRELRVRRGNQDTFFQFEGLELLSTQQTFVLNDEEVAE